MGSKKNLVLASLVSLVMALAFVIGLLPMQAGAPRPDAEAAPGAVSVAISVDSATPVGTTYSVPVGSEQGFSALRLTGSTAGLLAGGEVQWSLATDGAAVLTSGPTDPIATVSALAPGEAALYVTTADGLVDVVDLTFYALKAGGVAKELTALEITQPEDGVNIFIPTGATVPMAMTAEADDPADVSQVIYRVGQAEEVYSADTAPYVAVLEDIAGVDPGVIDAFALRVSDAQAIYAPAVNFNVIDVVPDTDGDGFPDNFLALLDLNLQAGDKWLALGDNGDLNRLVALLGLGDFLPPVKQFVEFPAEGAVITLARPDDPTRYVRVAVPAGLLLEGEAGVLVVATADDPAGLLGSDEAGNLDTLPANGLVNGGQYIAIDILVLSQDGLDGPELSPIELDALVDNPVVVEIGGVGVAANGEAAFYVHPAAYVGGPPQPTKDLVVSGTWAKVQGGTEVETGVMRAALTELGVVAPFDTEGISPNILTIVNVSPTANQSLAQAYSIGGETLEITLANVLDSDSVDVTIDDQVIAGLTPEEGVVTVTVPAANMLAEPAESAVVDVRVDVNGDFDVEAGGLTYVGPDIDSVTPAIGSGGTAIEVSGAGFGTGLSASFDGLALLNVAVAAEGYYFTATVPAGGVGTVGLQVTNANNYYGAQANAFTYLGDPPILSTVTPDAVLSDGGYTVTLAGANLENLAGATQVYFTAVAGVVDPDADIPAQSIVSVSDEEIVVTTPVHDPGVFDVYVAHVLNGGTVNSDSLEFTFVDPAASPVTVTAVNPNVGPTEGGTEVEILGTGFPEFTPQEGVVKGADPASETVLRVDVESFTPGGSVTVQMSLFRDPEADLTIGPSTLNGTITYDPAVLNLDRSGLFILPSGIFELDSPQLLTWYGKQVQGTINAEGTISFVISGGVRQITTVDNQRPQATGESENPFPLFELTFDFVGDLPAEGTTIGLTGVALADPDAVAFPGTTQDALIRVEQGPVVLFGGVPAQVLSSTETRIVAVTPPHAAGSVDVRVENPNLPEPANFGILANGFTYVQPGAIEVTPNEAFEATITEGGVSTPITKVYNVVTAGGGDVAWTASADADWVEVDPASGNGAGAVTVSINTNANSLAVGTHNATVTFSGGGVTITRDVILTVVQGGVVTVTDITPKSWWLFGGVIATITGTGFDDTSNVYLGTTLDIANLPLPAQVVSVTANQIQVVIPPLVTLSSDAQIEVQVGVQTGANFSTLPGNLPVYVQYEVEGDVATSAFFFPTNVGTAGAVNVLLNTGLDTARLFVPSLPAGNFPSSPRPSVAFGLAHATKDVDLLAPGTADGSDIANVWNFGVHLYYGDYDETDSGANFGAELEVVRNTGEVPAVLTFPTADTTLPVAEVTAGEVSLYATNTSFAYGDPLADDVEAGYNTTGLTAAYQSNIIGPNVPEYASANRAEFEPVTGTEVDLVRARLYDLGGTYVLRQNASPPVVQAFIENASVGTSTVNVSFIGDGLGWPRRLFVGLKANNPAQSLADALEDPNQFVTVDLDDLNINRSLGDFEYSFNSSVSVNRVRNLQTFRQATPVNGVVYVNIYIEMAYETGGVSKAVAQNLVRAVNPANPNGLALGIRPGGRIPGGLGAVVIGLLAALIGLFAGGGGDSSGGPCFIATAAYGTPMADQIGVLREFRDVFLLSNPLGTAFVDLYYTVSPSVADTVAQSPVLAAVVRVVLVPVMLVARVLLAMPMVSMALAMLGFAMMSVRMYGRRSRKA